jgi:hypothetical protein
MATKYNPRKKHNAGTVRTSTNTTGGSRTRNTVTTKPNSNYTKSRSVNRNGTVKLTSTHKSPSGFVTRTSQSVGSKPSKIKEPKFITYDPFKAPRKRKSKSRARGGSRKSSGGGILILMLFGLIAGLFQLVRWTFSLIFSLIGWVFSRFFNK